MTQAALSGFANPVYDATHVFREALAALSRPGHMVQLDQHHDVPVGLNQSATALLLCLSDMDTPIWLAPDLDTPECREFIAFNTGSRVVDRPEQSVFAVVSAHSDPSYRQTLRTGTSENPDQSATLIVVLPSLDQGPAVTLSGPGVETTATINPEGIDANFWTWFSEKAALFPCGIDVFFTSGSLIAGLPRSVKVEV